MKCKKYIDHICEELDGACHYGYKYIEYKSEKPRWAGYYHDMAKQELSHAEMLVTMGKEYLESLAYKTADMEEQWDHMMKKYAEKTALVELMLSK